MDGNLKAGPEIIPGDPHPINVNGKMFKEFLLNNSHLTVVNSLDLCSGLITRRRQTIHRLEEAVAVLDVFVVCDKVLSCVKKMVVDEEKEFVLTNYNKVKGEIITKDSDHNTLVLYLDIPYSTIKPKRVEFFNLKNGEGQERFKSLTSNCEKLSKCFENSDNFSKQSTKFEKVLKSCIQQSFTKIRITNNIKKTSDTNLIDERFKLKQRIKLAEDDDTREALEKSLEEVEKQLANTVCKANFEKVVENLSLLGNDQQSFSSEGMWKAKKKVFPKHNKPLPVAKEDENGRLISCPEELKNLYLKTYIHRLRHRPIRPELSQLGVWKMELFHKRIELVKLKKVKPWDIKSLRVVLKSLKKNKSRDPHELINELFRPENIGSDIESSLLQLLNKTKETYELPEFMQYANIVSIYKGKGKKNSLDLRLLCQALSFNRYIGRTLTARHRQHIQCRE